MRVVRTPLVCAIVSVFLLSMVGPVTGEVPDHDEDIYTWKWEGDDASATGCSFISPSGPTDEGAAQNSPCEIISYEIGNTNTHVFYRWTVATLEFGGTLPTDAYVVYDQGFRGSAEEDRRFEFQIRVDADEISVESAFPEGLDASIEVGIIGDRSDGVFVAAVPLEELEPRFEQGLVAGEWFNLSRDPSSEAGPPGHSILCFASLGETFCGGDTLANAATEGNRTFALEPYLELQPAPAVFYEDVSGIPLEIEIVHDEPTTRTPWISHTYVYNWTLDSPAVDIAFDAVVDEGSADVSFSDPFDDVLFDFLGAGSDEASLVGIPAGVYTVEVNVEQFVGSITLSFTEGELPDGVNPGGGGGGDGGDGDGDGGSDGDGGGGLQENEESPAPAGLLLLTLLLTGLVSLRRLRRSS